MTYSPIIAPDRVPVVRAHPAASAVTTLGRLEGGAPFEVILMAASQLRHSDSPFIQAPSSGLQDQTTPRNQSQSPQFESRQLDRAGQYQEPLKSLFVWQRELESRVLGGDGAGNAVHYLKNTLTVRIPGS